MSKKAITIEPNAPFGPTFTFVNDDARPYWKNNGTGREMLMVQKSKRADKAVRFKGYNAGEKGKGAKETWVELLPDEAKALLEFLQKEFPQS